MRCNQETKTMTRAIRRTGQQNCKISFSLLLLLAEFLCFFPFKTKNKWNWKVSLSLSMNKNMFLCFCLIGRSVATDWFTCKLKTLNLASLAQQKQKQNVISKFIIKRQNLLWFRFSIFEYIIQTRYYVDNLVLALT